MDIFKERVVIFRWTLVLIVAQCGPMRATKPIKTPKDKVIRARCDASTQTLIYRAANAMNLDISDFIRIASTHYATQVTAQFTKAQPFVPFA